MAGQDADFTTTIGPDATFTGKLQFEKGARVLGSIDGEIGTAGQLVIADSGKLAGEARAGNVRVEGQVKGNLHVSGKVQLAASARVEGDIEAAKLEVAEGAVLIGRLSVGVKPEDRTAASARGGATAPERGSKPARETAEAAAPVGAAR